MQTHRLVALGIAALALASVAVADGPVFRTDQKAGTADQVAAGKEKFAMCVGCHGADGEGKVGVAPALNSDSYLTVVPDEFLARTVKEGRTGTNMIAWGAMMSDDDVTNVVAYIRHWQQSNGIELDQSALAGDRAKGEELYFKICSTCHGRSGAGYSESGSGSGIGRKAFLDQASDGVLRGVIKNGKDNTPMRPFAKGAPTAVADLTDEEIDSIIMYLRAAAW